MSAVLNPCDLATTIIDQDGVALYYPDFLGKQADDYLALAIRQVPWRQDSIVVYGKSHLQPRLSAWYSNDGYSYAYSGIVMEGGCFPDFINGINELMATQFSLQFNSVLLNYYRDGKDKMGWHSDDEATLGDAVYIASISLGADRCFQLRHKYNKNIKPISVTLEHGSLLLMKPPLQCYWQHQLPSRLSVTAARVNLTFRNIMA